MWDTEFKGTHFVISETSGLGQFWPFLLFGIALVALSNIDFYLKVGAISLAAFFAIAGLLKRKTVTFDPMGRAFTVRRANFFKVELKTYFFDDLLKPFEAVATNSMNRRITLRAYLRDGTVLTVADHDRVKSQAKILDTVERMNEIAYGKLIPAVIKRTYP